MSTNRSHKISCPFCSEHIEVPEDAMGQWTNCPHCNKEIPLEETEKLAPPKKVVLPPSLLAPPPPPPQPAHLNVAQQRLQKIRSQTCYRTLRSVIDGCLVVVFIVAAISTFWALMTLTTLIALSPGSDGRSGSATQAGLILIMTVLVVIFGIAMKQAAVLLVDIADCQIQNAKD